MERYVVSARKYRPETFDTVVGQQHVTGTLLNAVRTGHVAQAFLFTGPRGVGKTTCARILARTINCENLNADLTTCGTCPSCRTFEEGHSLNIFELDAASNNSVEDIRNLIQQVQIAPQVGTKKVYIIDEVHMLSPAAFNAFLKTLEEPPSYAIFILATTEKHKILPTILSRCQVFDFRRITVGDISDHLAKIAREEGIAAEPQALHTIAQKADGGLRDALSIFDQLVSYAGNSLTYSDVREILNVLDQEQYFALTEHLLNGDTAAALILFNEILFQGFDGHLFIAGLARHFRDLLVSQDPRTIPLLEVSEEQRAHYAAQAKAVPRERLVQWMAQLSAVDNQYKNSKEPRLLVELALIQLAQGPERAATPAPSPAPVAEKKNPELSRATPAPQVAAITQAAKPAAPPASPPATRRVAGAVSIRKHLDPPPAQAALADQPGMQPGAADSVDMPGRELNQALLLRAWQQHAEQLKREHRTSMYATLMTNDPVITGPRSISFSIVNTVQENYMREEKPALLGHLRRSLGIPDLELAVQKNDAEKVRPRYTPKDRFMIMAEKNPALFKLREDLDLDLGQ